MFVDVPDPVWKTSIGNWSSSSPASTRRAASPIAAATSAVDAGHVERRVDGRSVALDRGQRVGDADVERAVGDREVAHGQVGLLAPRAAGARPCVHPTEARPDTAVPLLRFPAGAPRRHVRRRPVRPRRRPHPDRGHPPAGVDDDVRRVPRAAWPTRRSPTTTTSRYVDGKPRFDGVRIVPRISRHHAPGRRSRRSAGPGVGACARQPQERRVPGDPADVTASRRIRARCGTSTTSSPRARTSPSSRRHATPARCSTRPG